MREGKLLLLYLRTGEPTFRAELRAVDETESRLFDSPRSLCDHLERIARPADGRAQAQAQAADECLVRKGRP